MRLLFDLSHILVTERSEGLGAALGRGRGAARVRPGDRSGTGTRRRADAGVPAAGRRVSWSVRSSSSGTASRCSAAETRVVRTFADEVALVVQAERLQGELREAEDYRRTEDVRQAMLAAASHELKSPVAAITASVTDVLGREGFDEAVAREVLEDVRASTGRLEQLITNLLDMSRIESGTLVAHDEVVAARRDRDGSRSTAFASAGRASRSSSGCRRMRAVVRGDPVFVDRVVTNLARERGAGGAERRRPPDRGPRGARSATMVEVAVIDHGPGLAFGDQQSLFTPFYRLREGSPRLSAGLGLAICKGFVTAMGGEIRAIDTPGRRHDDRVPARGARRERRVGARRRRRAADPPRGRAGAHRPRLRRANRDRRPRRRRRGRRARARPRRARPQPAAHGRAHRLPRDPRARAACRSSCCRCATRSRTRWPRSTSVRTTT